MKSEKLEKFDFFFFLFLKGRKIIKFQFNNFMWVCLEGMTSSNKSSELDMECDNKMQALFCGHTCSKLPTSPSI